MKTKICNAILTLISVGVLVTNDALAAQYTFSPGGSIITARANHTATLLQNGKVLVAGGHLANGNPTTAAELYDPLSLTSSTSTAPMPDALWLHTATLLRSGKVLVAGGVDILGDRSARAYIFDPATETWSTTGSLNTARSQHTATLLANGKILVAGGINGTGTYLATVELYDPATGAWTPTGAMAGPRVSHTATLLPNGKVLVAGGSTSTTTLATAELYDPATGLWGAASSMSVPRRFHSASLLPNGIVLVAGGANTGGNLSSAQLYDPASGTWTATGSMATTRSQHSATVLPNGRIVVAGGASGSELTTAQIYDPPSGTWSAAGSMTTARSGHTATVLPNGLVAIIGGGANGTNKIELFDSASPESILLASSNYGLGQTSTLLPNNQVIQFGGFYAGPGTNYHGAWSGAFRFYDPVNRIWTFGGVRGTGRAYHTATLLPNGKLLIAGGASGSSSSLASCELYNFVDGQWTITGSFAFNAPRSHHSATLLADGKKVLIAGGRDDNGPVLATAQLYDIASGTWSLTGSMPFARADHTATLLPNGKVLVAGAETVTMLYDPGSGTWSTTGSMNHARGGHTATLLPNGRVLVAGGQNSVGLDATAELYDPATGTWRLTGSMARGIIEHTATLLPNGRVTVLGGRTGPDDDWSNIVSGAGAYDSASETWTDLGTTGGVFCAGHTATLLPRGEILIVGGYSDEPDDHTNSYYPYTNHAAVSTPGLGYNAPDWQPIVNGRPPLFLGEKMGIGGARYRGVSQASSGNTQDSSTSYPLVQLRSETNEQTIWLPVDPTAGWSDTNFTTAPVPANFPLGPARVTVYSNGIPSDSRYISVATLNAASRKMHNGVPYDIPLPFTGAPGIECRNAGMNNSYQVVFKFNVPVNTGNAVAYPWNGTAEVDGPPVKSADSREVTVNLKNVTPQCGANIALQGIVDATNPGNSNEAYDGVIPFNVLVGDTSADKSVNSADIAQAKSKSGQAVDAFNFRMDVTADGSINSADIALVKSKSGTAIP